MKTSVSHVNLFDDCLRLIVRKGWKVSLDIKDCTDEYIAEKDDVKLVGDNPIELLGLIGLAENASEKENDYWWGYVEGEDNLWTKLVKERCL